MGCVLASFAGAASLEVHQKVGAVSEDSLHWQEAALNGGGVLQQQGQTSHLYSVTCDANNYQLPDPTSVTLYNQLGTDGACCFTHSRHTGSILDGVSV